MSNHVKGMTSCRPPESEKSNESQMDLINRIECAIRHIQTAVDVDPWAVEIAVEAMEKQIPKKPMKSIDPHNSNLYKLNCPECGKYIAYGNSRVGTLHKWTMTPTMCGYCGQVIDWEGE